MSFLAELFLAVAALLVLLAFHRLPGAADRLVAVDVLSACALAACIIAAARTGHTAFLDVALGFALISFLATVSWAFTLRGAASPGDAP